MKSAATLALQPIVQVSLDLIDLLGVVRGGLTLEQAMRAPEYGAPLGVPLAVDAEAFKTDSGDLEGSLRLICAGVHRDGEVAIGRSLL
jgi:hypothetical protein